jgi:hypothetical protein
VRVSYSRMMEAIMATTMHHHHVDTFDVPSRVYWAAGIGLALLAMLMLYSTAAGTMLTSSITPALMEQPPIVPFIPLI